ncbi:hypothetical protein DH2020_043094 [Rehmannia glutinosa]|uniref:RRM domain-containing protein n=1 Tax=Rehmannia glutinosa TaxID=99300 RepID=A0ABR0UM89_REHGL
MQREGDDHDFEVEENDNDKAVGAMAFFRKTGNILGRTVSNHISLDISSSTIHLSGDKMDVIFEALYWRCDTILLATYFLLGLSYSTDDNSLREAFNKSEEKLLTVHSKQTLPYASSVFEIVILVVSKYCICTVARVIVDRETGRSRGFGFVTYSSIEEASSAIQALDQQDLHGRRIRVDYANDRTRGFGGGGGGGYNSGSFGGSYGGGGGGYNNNDGYSGGGYGGSSNYNSGFNSYGSSTGPQVSNNGYDGGNSSYGGDHQGFNEDKSVERNYRDDDDTDNFADRRS